MNDLLKIKIDNLPNKPGVYIMRNAGGDVIYVGKAKILKNRVRQYFQSQNNHEIKVRKMVENIADLEYLITDSEVEALMLECNLIKQYRPRYNIMMKDDKSYPYLKLTTMEEYPKLELTRKRGFDKNKYFGPYVNAYAARKTMEAIKLFYPLKMCNKKVVFGQQTGRVCLNYHLGQCLGVCRGDIDPILYMKYISNIQDILSKKPEALLRRLQEEMEKEAELLHFEAAGTIKDLMSAVQNLSEDQKISNTSFDERDIIALAPDDNSACIQMFIIRDGKIVSTNTKYMKQNVGDESEEVLSSFIQQYYSSGAYIPREIIVQMHPAEEELLKNFLRTLRGTKTEIIVPVKGDKKRLLDLAVKNAYLNIETKKTREQQIKSQTDNAEKELRELLHTQIPLFRIEAYDISNLAGTDNVGVMVAFENGKKCSSALRRFKIKYVDGQNDYGSMGEVVFRRLSRAKEEIETEVSNPKFLPLPEVILVDGGLAHVRTVKSIVENFGYPIIVAGLVKDNKHKLRALMRDDGTEISIKDIKYAARLLNDISEEVHRAAIGYHKIKRSKSMLKTELEDIPGIGKKRSVSLLKVFGSIKRIKNASVEELCAAEGMNISAAQKVYGFYHKEE